MVLSSPPLERIIRRYGAERVSKKAAKKLALVLEEYGMEISQIAMKFAHEDNRKTVRREDIKKAIKVMAK